MCSQSPWTRRASLRLTSGSVTAILLAAFLSGCAATAPAPPAPPLPADRGAVLDTARAQIGRPYRTAGESPREGFDCSGLVQWVYARHGVRLPRSTADQAHTCRPVAWGQLRAGDLVFFTPSLKTDQLHVGIFDGRGGFIHSPRPGGRVREESIMAPYWRTAFYMGCRVLP
jgi:cell wall-associated NlpC family hydrolase